MMHAGRVGLLAVVGFALTVSLINSFPNWFLLALAGVLWLVVLVSMTRSAVRR